MLNSGVECEGNDEKNKQNDGAGTLDAVHCSLVLLPLLDDLPFQLRQVLLRVHCAAQASFKVDEHTFDRAIEAAGAEVVAASQLEERVDVTEEITVDPALLWNDGFADSVAAGCFLEALQLLREIVAMLVVAIGVEGQPRVIGDGRSIVDVVRVVFGELLLQGRKGVIVEEERCPLLVRFAGAAAVAIVAAFAFIFTNLCGTHLAFFKLACAMERAVVSC